LTSDGSAPDVRVMTWAGGWGHALRNAVSASFSERTGYGVSHHTHVGLRLPVELEIALETGAPPPFDVVWSNSGPALRMARRGLTEALDGLSELEELHPRARPEGCGDTRGSWPLVYTYVVFYVLVYRRSLFAQSAPSTWEVLLDDRHQGKVALYPGGNGFYPIAQRMGGGAHLDIPEKMDPCWDFLRRLAPQIGTLDYSIGMGELLRRGDLDLCFRALTNALAFRREGLDVDFATPSEGITDTLDCMWIPRGLSEERVAAARRYIAHAISRDVQSQWCDGLGALPVHRAATVPRLLREHPGLPGDVSSLDGVLHLSESLKADHQERWEAEFDRVLAGARSLEPNA